jgi:hypothetical protein
MTQIVQDTGIIYLSNVRVGFADIAVPKPKTKMKDGQQITENVWSATFLMEPSHSGFVKFWEQYAKIAAEKWKQNAQAVMNMIQNDKKSRCYGDGNTSVNMTSLKPYAGFPNNYYITASKTSKPQIMDAEGLPVSPLNDIAWSDAARRIYRGCYVNAAIKPWLQDNVHGKGVRCELAAIQFSCDGEALAQDEDVSGMFGAVQGAALGGFSPAPGNVPAAPFAPAPAPGMPAAPFAPPVFTPR